MRTVGAYEAKTHLPQLLGEIAKGQSITITKHGVPVAMLVPPRGARSPDPVAMIEELRRFRRGISLDGLSLRELIEEGRL